MNNYAEIVSKQIEELMEKKESELQLIRTKKAEAEKSLELAIETTKEATAKMDLKAYEKSKADEGKYKTAINMYAEKYEQIKNQEYISEEESDKVIYGLLNYEKELAEEFNRDVEKPIKELAEICIKYYGNVRKAEQELKRWTKYIHAFYRSPGTSITLPDGTTTNRHNEPQELHKMGYGGCKEYIKLRDFIMKGWRKLYKN